MKLLWLCTYTTWLMMLSECIPCYHTPYGPAVETCEINPDEDQYCTINCDRVNASAAHCSLYCHIDSFFPCNNMTTPDHFQLCCTTPYCNNITSVFLPTSFTPSPTSFTPSPTSSPVGTNKDTSDDVHIHIVIAVCVVVVVLVVAIVTGCVVVMWMKLRSKRSNELLLTN
ncbi:uncharacterized protein [Dysidea avara]|uniref:uncharacterized protein n=1 Tax=Dysidea avara TaxID=196820 RepID=UPI003333E401